MTAHSGGASIRLAVIRVMSCIETDLVSPGSALEKPVKNVNSKIDDKVMAGIPRNLRGTLDWVAGGKIIASVKRFSCLSFLCFAIIVSVLAALVQV